MKVSGDTILAQTGCTNATSPIDCLRGVPARNISTLGQARYFPLDGIYIVADHL
jgi:hypothetical protein